MKKILNLLLVVVIIFSILTVNVSAADVFENLPGLQVPDNWVSMGEEYFDNSTEENIPLAGYVSAETNPFFTGAWAKVSTANADANLLIVNTDGNLARKSAAANATSTYSNTLKNGIDLTADKDYFMVLDAQLSHAASEYMVKFELQDTTSDKPSTPGTPANNRIGFLFNSITGAAETAQINLYRGTSTTAVRSEVQNVRLYKDENNFSNHPVKILMQISPRDKTDVGKRYVLCKMRTFIASEELTTMPDFWDVVTMIPLSANANDDNMQLLDKFTITLKNTTASKGIDYFDNIRLYETEAKSAYTVHYEDTTKEGAAAIITDDRMYSAELLVPPKDRKITYVADEGANWYDYSSGAAVPIGEGNILTITPNDRRLIGHLIKAEYVEDGKTYVPYSGKVRNYIDTSTGIFRPTDGNIAVKINGKRYVDESTLANWQAVNSNLVITPQFHISTAIDHIDADDALMMIVAYYSKDNDLKQIWLENPIDFSKYTAKGDKQYPVLTIPINDAEGNCLLMHSEADGKVEFGSYFKVFLWNADMSNPIMLNPNSLQLNDVQEKVPIISSVNTIYINSRADRP